MLQVSLKIVHQQFNITRFTQKSHYYLHTSCLQFNFMTSLSLSCPDFIFAFLVLSDSKLK
uniref:Uncharacterized protein n=1 Tax=Arundo donax TaxID=35708 RepID=A0A0A8ZQX6_ARUDO